MEPFARIKNRPQTISLGQALQELMNTRQGDFAQRYETASRLTLLWMQLLPPALVQHCRIVDLSQGLLTVEVDSPSYMYELRVSSHELLQHLRQGCPSAKLKSIRFALAR